VKLNFFFPVLLLFYTEVVQYILLHVYIQVQQVQYTVAVAFYLLL
jgi:hypothetical protein